MKTGRNSLRLSQRLLPFAIALAIGGCAGGEPSAGSAPGDGRGTVATIGDQSIPYEEFRGYVRDIVGGETKGIEGESQIMSSLLDQFLGERLLERAGKDLGVAVSEAEIDAYMKEIGMTGGDQEGADQPADATAFRDKIRRSLILQKVKDKAVLSKVQVTDGEVDDYLSGHPDLLQEPRTLVLRQIMVDDKQQAESLRRTLVADPGRFESLALEHSAAPDGGQPRSYREEELPAELLEPLRALREGAISDVLELSGNYLIFQMVRRIDSAPVDRDKVRSRVRLELYQRKVDDVLAGFLDDLKKKTTIHVNRSILPFRYQGEHRD